MSPLTRADIPELMDQPDLSQEELSSALGDLARLNRICGGSRMITNLLESVIPEGVGRTWKILDIGTGSGDIPGHVLNWAYRTDRRIRICAVDFNLRSLKIASSESLNNEVQFVCADAGRLPFGPSSFDVVMASQFIHHFGMSEAQGIFRSFREMAREAVVISDLHRTRVSLLLTYLGTRLFVRSPIVRYDGPISIRRSFIPSEFTALAEEAGYRDFKVITRFPCRLAFIGKTRD